MTTDALRYALVTLPWERDNPVPYMPGNYSVLVIRPHPEKPEQWRQALVGGYDNAGWTLDDYVLPRLASGGMSGHEIPADHEAVKGLAECPHCEHEEEQ